MIGHHQHDILDTLRSGRWMKARTVIDDTGIAAPVAQRSLRALLSARLVVRKHSGREYVYRITTKGREELVEIERQGRVPGIKAGGS